MMLVTETRNRSEEEWRKKKPKKGQENERWEDVIIQSVHKII